MHLSELHSKTSIYGIAIPENYLLYSNYNINITNIWQYIYMQYLNGSSLLEIFFNVRRLNLWVSYSNSIQEYTCIMVHTSTNFSAMPSEINQLYSATCNSSSSERSTRVTMSSNWIEEGELGWITGSSFRTGECHQIRRDTWTMN